MVQNYHNYAKVFIIYKCYYILLTKLHIAYTIQNILMSVLVTLSNTCVSNGSIISSTSPLYYLGDELE